MKEILSNQLLTVLKKKLSGGSSRSIHLNAIPSNSRVKLQASDLNKLSKKDTFKDFLEKLTTTANLKFPLNFENSDAEKNKKTLNRLKYLSRQNKDYFLEHGLEPFGFGYPIIAKRDLKNPKKFIYSPLIIWNLKLIENPRKIQSFQISRNEDTPVKINEVLLNYIEAIDKVNFDKLPKEFLDDGIIDFEEIKILVNNFLNSFTSDQVIDDRFFDEYVDLVKVKEFEEEITHTPQVINAGVFGLYLSQKESIINDIEKLKKKRPSKEYVLTDYEKNPFSPVITDQSQQQILSNLNSSNKFVIHGPPGTGKSQTLTATLSSALKNNKTCLVVCEKKTALDIIQKNLEDIGLGEFSTLIEDPVRDRRKVVNAARDLLENNIRQLDQLNYKKNIKFDNGRFSARSISNKHDEHLNSITDKIEKLQDIKSQLLYDLLDGNDFKGILEKINFNFDYLAFEKQYSLSKTRLLFKNKEYKKFITLFEKLKFILFDVNPFESFYEVVNEKILLKNDFNSFEVLMNEKLGSFIDELFKIQTYFQSNKEEPFELHSILLKRFYDSTKYDNKEHFYEILEELKVLFNASKSQNVNGVIFKIKKIFSKKLRTLHTGVNTYKEIIKRLYSSELLKNELHKKIELSEAENSIDFILQNLKSLENRQQKYRPYLSLISKLNDLEIFKEKFKVFNTGAEICEGIEYILSLNEKIVSQKHHFRSLKEFASIYNCESEKVKRILFLFITEKDFESKFLNYYFIKVLNSNNLGILSDNGFPEDLLGISNDLKRVNIGAKWSTILMLQEQRNIAIDKFKKTKTIKIEQLFAKRSSTKNRKLSLRAILEYDFDLFTDFFPILLTNPTTVSSLLPLKPNLFDIVLFDEASQLRIEDTVPSLYRAKVKIVSGDQKQMPPSSYFSSVEIEDSEAEIDLLSTVDFAFKESLLEFSIDAGFKNIYLDMHYRSKHPDLIEFSNRAFYNGRLVALPPQEEYNPIEFFQVNGAYTNRTNREEALKIVQYLKENIVVGNTVGIATFNLDQRNLIMDEINNEIQKNSVFSEKMMALEASNFFVKNLENIQGDERDIIIISTTFGLDYQGDFKQFFGPVNNKTKGHKLLNVIVTRAKKKMIVMTSVPETYYLSFKDYLDKEGLVGKAVFYSYLAYAKAIASNDDALKQKVLNTIYTYSDSKNILDVNKSTEGLSIKIKEDLENVLSNDYSVKLTLKLGGYLYDLCVYKVDNPVMVIDLDGKNFYNTKDDYLFDVGRKNVAVSSGLLYYRLWSMNYFNAKKEELNRISSKLGAKQVK
jgi:superfamily I DNA and/or RNA helicase